MTTPLPYYANRSEFDVDRSHLKTLAVCHYVWGGLTIAFSSIFIIHIVMGIVFAMNAGTGPPNMPRGFGYLISLIGLVVVLAGWTLGILTIYSGRCLARQRRKLFSMIIAGINCMSVPFGTTLGIFTFVVLALVGWTTVRDGRISNRGGI